MINFNPFFVWDFSILCSCSSKAEQWSYLDGQTYKILQEQANWMATKIMQTQSPLCLGHFASRSFQFFLQPLSSHCNRRKAQQPSPLAPLWLSSPCTLPTLTYKTQLHLVAAHFTSFIQNKASEPNMGEIPWWLSCIFRVLIKSLISQISCNICALFFQGKTCTQIWPHQRPQTCC